MVAISGMATGNKRIANKRGFEAKALSSVGMLGDARLMIFWNVITDICHDKIWYLDLSQYILLIDLKM